MKWEIIGISIYVTFQFGIGLYLFRFIKTEDDYFLAGRRLGPILASFSIFATWFGAETCIGSSGAIYAGGLAGARADPFGYPLCLVLMGMLFATRMWKRQLVTLGDLYRQRYSTGVERLAVILMIPVSLFWAGVQVRAVNSCCARGKECWYVDSKTRFEIEESAHRLEGTTQQSSSE